MLSCFNVQHKKPYPNCIAHETHDCLRVALLHKRKGPYQQNMKQLLAYPLLYFASQFNEEVPVLITSREHDV